jgi:hypothetical protein
MNKYRNELRIAMHVCFIAFVTLCIAVSAGAQTIPAASATTPAAAGTPLFTVTHDGTLQGDGRIGSPLSITASPTVSGSLTVNGDIQAKNIVSANSTVNGDLAVTGNIQANATTVDGVITVNTVSAHSIIVDARDTSFTSAMRGGGSTLGVFGRGGAGIGPAGSHPTGGTGVEGMGGLFISTPDLPRVGGVGVSGRGGDGINGGAGVRGDGATTIFATGSGGVGVSSHGGDGIDGNGGVGVVAQGRSTIQSGNVGGLGIFAFGGPAQLGASAGLAGDFDGNVLIGGRLVKGSGSFKIDHPLDPENKYLSHSFVESPDMMNIYNGNMTTDSNGDALVQLPDYFNALNRDFRYQLTAIGTFADSIVAEKITDNHFRIKTSSPNVKVSWQVTGIRQDAYANRSRIPVEEDKPEAERGFYLHPEAFGQPLEKSILTAKQPEIVRQVEEASGKARQVALQQK